MGSVVSIAIMHTLTFLFFFCLSCLCPVLADQESIDCSVVSLADVRRVIPDNAVNAKKFLYKIWSLSKKDYCQLPFHELHNSEIFYRGLKNFQRNTNEKVTIGNIIKDQMKDLINELEEIVPNLDFLKSFTLNNQDVKKAIQGFVCSWQNERSVDGLQLFFPDGFDEVMAITGVENIDIEDTKAVVKKFMKDIIATEVTHFLTKHQEKFKSLMYDLVPLFSEFKMMLWRLDKGEQIELENLLMKTAGGFHDIFNFLDSLFTFVCFERNIRMNEVFSKSASSFFHLASQRVNENKKIDFKGLIEILTETDAVQHYIKTELGRLEKFIDLHIDNIKKGYYGYDIVHFMVELVSPGLGVPREQLRIYEERYNVRTEVLQAGAIWMLVDILLF